MSRAQRIWSEWALIGVALMVPLGVQALGLGEARVESFLNQTLDVRMRLLDASEDDLDSLTVAPASPEDYRRLGLMGDSLGLNLEVRVDRSVSPPVVRVTSDRVVTDPVVQLLIDARWSSGRVLREYTLFLDPATVAVEAPAPAPAPAQAAPPATAEPDSTDEAAPATPTQPSSVPARSQASQDRPRAAARGGARSYGPVASGDTLWSIARANLPSGEVTMNQMMIAIVELNPRAFRDRNINQLLRGAELELPDAGQAMALDAAAAAAEVAAQNRAYRRRVAGDTPVVSEAGRSAAGDGAGDGAEEGAASDAPARASGTADDAADDADGAATDHRLSLVPPGDDAAGSGLSDQEEAEIADLRQRLARAEEELYAARQEAEEFQSRVEELENLVRDDPGALGLRDAELAGLEETLRAAREATREDADPALRSRVSERLDDYLGEYAAASDDAGTGPTGEVAAATEGGDSSGDGEEDAAATPESAASEQPAEPEAPESSSERPVTRIESSGGLLGNPVLLIVVGLVVLLLLAAAARIVLRRRAETETARPAERTPAVSVKPATGSDTPLERARAGVQSRPAELAAHLDLLQSLATEGNEAGFGEALEEMFGYVESGEEPEWREALELVGRVAPGHPLVKGSSDWVSDSDETGLSEPVSEIDEESEVDDLMSRLDTDLDESDDRDWLGEDDAEDSRPDGPLLRDPDPLRHSDDTGGDGGDDGASGSASEALSQIGEDASIDFGDLDETGGRSSSADGGETTGPEDTADDVDDLILDWGDGEDDAVGASDAAKTGPGESQAVDESESVDRGETPGGPTDEGDDSDDAIFAQSDDDIDVKLDLARAYLSWNSTDSARTLLEEVVREGNEAQQEEARKLLDGAGDGDED